MDRRISYRDSISHVSDGARGESRANLSAVSTGQGRVPRPPGSRAGVVAFWQHPFVDVFKTFGVDTAERRGDVVEDLDKQISKRVFKIRGAVAANNYIRLPPSKGAAKTLGLTGEYVYFQIKDVGMKFFVVHLDFTVASINVLRVTLSNMYSEVKVASHTVQCPCYLVGKWSVVCVHVPSVLALCSREKPHAAPHAFVLKSIQLCSTIVVRNVYTSDNRYTPDNLPKDMLLDQQDGFEERYSWVDVPGPFAKELDPSASSLMGLPLQEKTDGDSISYAQMPLQNRNGHQRSGKVAHEELEATGSSIRGDSSVMDATTGRTAHDVGTASCRVADDPLGRIPDPMLEVSRLVGVSRKNRRIAGLDEAVPRRFAVFVRAGAGDSSSMMLGFERGDVTSGVLHASSMTLTTLDLATYAQRYFFGHSKQIELLEASDDGLWVASVQGAESGAPPLLRLWRVETQGGALHCVSVLSCPSLSAVRVASFCPLAKYLALGGADLQNRQQIMVWDLSSILAGGSVALLARQTSADWDIDCIKFSPFDELHLVTCGHENIRFWRVKDGHLPGRNVVLNALARQTQFTCIAFEFNKMGQPYFLGEHMAQHQRMFVGTAKGKVLQLSYKDLKVQVVYSLHNEAITSMCANEGFVVTASADGYVRVWPLDFKSFYLHAMHSTPVVGVDITVDGLQVLCCTADGSVGILDMQSHAYTDLVRSHGAVITDAALSVSRHELVTASCDGTIKVWSLASMSQTYEFVVADDVPLVMAYHPGERHQFAVGFKSGSMRVFDVDGPAMLCEHHHHLRPIVSLLFVAEGSGVDEVWGRVRVISCDTSGALAIYDEAVQYEVVRTPERPLCATPPDRCAAIVCAPPRLMQYRDPQSVVLCSYPGLEPVRRLRVASSFITALDFSCEGRLALLCTADSQLYAFSASTGDFVITYSFASGPVTACAMTLPDRLPPVVVVATADTMLRLSQLRAEELEQKEVATSQAALAAAGYHNAVAADVAPSSNPPLHAPLPNMVLLPRGRYDEQSFIGHSAAPHRILLSDRYVVSVSANEIISWAACGDYFGTYFLDDCLGDQARTIAGTCFGADDHGQVRIETASNGEASGDAQDESSLRGAQDADQLPEQSQQLETPSPRTTLLPTVSTALPTGGVPLAEMWMSDSVSSSSSSIPIREHKADASPEALQSDAQDSAAHANLEVDDVPSQGPGDVDDMAHHAGDESELQDEPSLVRACGGRSQASTSTVPRSRREAKMEFELLGLSGCASQFGAGAVAWSLGLGVLCHTIGSAVYVEDLANRHGARQRDAGSSGRCLASLPGLEAFALDLGEDGFLAVLSAAAPNADATVWLSLWSLDELSQQVSVPLPDGYAAHWQRYRSSLSGQVASEAPPLMRLLRGSRGAVTTATFSTAAFRVDVWDFVGSGCSLRCSAELPHRPLDIALFEEAADDAGETEFLTLCADAIVFWRISSAEELGEGTPSMCYQFADRPETWNSSGESNVQATAMAVVTAPDSRRLLFVGTSTGRVWVYDADENCLEGEMCFEVVESEKPGKWAGPVHALACGSWPLLFCARGEGALRAWFIEEDRLGGRRLSAAPAGPCMHLDGAVSSLRMAEQSGCPYEGIAATMRDTLWFVDAEKGTCVPLQRFHSAPSQALRSNASVVAAGCESADGGSAVEVLATSAADGSLWVWSVDSVTGPPTPRPLAQFAVGGGGLAGVCTTFTFIRSDLLVCGFAGGGLAVISLGDLTVAARLDPFEANCASDVERSTPGPGGVGDPVLAIEVLGADTVVVGGGSGRLVELQFELAPCNRSGGLGWSVAGLRRNRLPRSPHESALCRIQGDHGAFPSRFLVCFDNLELWLMECGPNAGSGIRHAQTWPWPENDPRPPFRSGCKSPQAALEMLAAPPLVASFAATEKRTGDFVAVVAPPASCIYVYSCTSGTIVNRVNIPSKFEEMSVLQMMPMPLPPPPPVAVDDAVHDAAADDDVVLVFCADRFARLAIGRDRRHVQWLEDPRHIPGGFLGQLHGRGGAPDACLLLDRACRDEALRFDGSQMLLVKGDTAFSCWRLRDVQSPAHE